MKKVVKKLVMSNKATRFLFGLVSSYRNRQLLTLSYEQYLNEAYVNVALNNGNTMCVYESDKKSHMYIDGSAYNDILNFIWADYVNQSDVVFDLGANYGQFVLNFIDPKQASEKQHIVMFEPNPKIAKALRESFTASGLSQNVTLVEKGISSEEGQFSFYINLLSSGGSSIKAENAFNPRDGIYRQEITIQTTTLDGYAKTNQIAVEDRKVAMKIDIEGHDFHAFEGAAAILSRASGFLLMMETTKSDAGEFLRKNHGKPVMSLFEKHFFYVTYKNSMYRVKNFNDYLTHFDIAPGCIDLVLSSDELNAQQYTDIAQKSNV